MQSWHHTRQRSRVQVTHKTLQQSGSACTFINVYGVMNTGVVKGKISKGPGSLSLMVSHWGLRSPAPYTLLNILPKVSKGGLRMSLHYFPYTPCSLWFPEETGTSCVSIRHLPCKRLKHPCIRDCQHAGETLQASPSCWLQAGLGHGSTQQSLWLHN